MILLRITVAACLLHGCLAAIARAASWPLSPWISFSHEIYQDYNCVVGGDRHGGERCGSQLYKTGFVISQIGLFSARGGEHIGVDIVSDNWTNVVSVDVLEVEKYDIETGGSDIVVNASNYCAEGDGDGAGIRYRNLGDWWGTYKYSYWHLGCMNYTVWDWWRKAEIWEIYDLYPGTYLGVVGETGNADDINTPNGAHLHFGVKRNSAWINPLEVLDDWSAPDAKFNYSVANYGTADVMVYSRQNSKLSAWSPVYAKTNARFGVETNDNAIVKKVRFDLLDSYYTLLAIKEFNLNPDSRITVPSSTIETYLES